MRLKLPHSLHYPITVTELLKQPNDDIERFAPLFNYTYQTTVTEIDRSGDRHEVKKTFPSRFESSVEGTLKSWMLHKGAVISWPGHEIAEIEEPCAHGVQYGGMCVACGKDMTEYSYVTTQLDASRANINMIHDNVALTVSQDEATKVETEAKRRLVAARKLSLVVDLDQTIIHATVDPTVAEWQKDPTNPNYEAVKDVRAFQLVDDGPGGRGTWYYIKLRPGLKDFLENISKIYELHIYTMGTRAYAQNIANLVDPDRKIFGDRILSRDESGSMVAKNLQRLFPVDTKMVVIIDDRADVWNWNPNLIKVTAFSFFIGIGDINSSFLPKLSTTRTVTETGSDTTSDQKTTSESLPEDQATTSHNTVTQTSNSTNEQPKKETEEATVSALEQLVSMGGGDDPNVLQAQNAQQDEILAAQLQERPLLQKQKQLDEEDKAEKDSEKPRHHLLSDDDNELYWLEQALRKVHSEFFDSYARSVADLSGGRLAELRGSQTTSKRKPPTADSDLDMIPDIKAVMPMVKSRTLSGVSLVFSGVIPLHTDLDTVEIVILAKSFGARIQTAISGRSTTHVVAARNRTAKVRQAVKRGKGKIKIVKLAWLLECIVQWRRVDESPYLMKTDDADIGKPFPDEQEEILSESESIASNMDTDTEAADPESVDNPKTVQQRLRIRTPHDTDDEDLEALLPDVADDEHSPVGGTGADWSDMHNEMEEFLGSDADDSDNDSVAGAKREVDSNGKPKRSHAEMTGSDSEDSSHSNGQRLSPNRKKLAVGRGTVLSQSQLSDAGLPTPAITAEEENGQVGRAEGEDHGGEGENGVASDHGWSDFDEDDLEAELERASDALEEDGQEGKERVDTVKGGA